MISPCGDSDAGGIVQLSPSGQLQTGKVSGAANVMVTSHEDFGFNQTVLAKVEVIQFFTFICLRSILSRKVT